MKTITILLLSLISIHNSAMSLKKRALENDAQLNIAVLDTGFCLKKLNYIGDNIKVHNADYMTPIFKIPCQRKTLLGRRFHGHYVLEEFLKNLKTEKQINIYPMVIFDKQGRQDIRYWDKALKKMKTLQIDLALIAAGHPIKTPIEKLPKLGKKPFYFLAVGKEGVGINKTTQLFPQIHHQKDNILMIGNYYPPTKRDQRFILDSSMLYLKHTDYFFSGGHGHEELRGSSRAVAVAAGKALSICGDKVMDKLKDCLKKNSRSQQVFHKEQTIEIRTY